MTDKAKSDKLGLGLVLIPFHSIYRIGAIFVEGLRYERDNWCKGVGDKDYQEERLEHALNHLFLYKEGDTSEDHLAKVAWFCVTQMELLRQESLHSHSLSEVAELLDACNDFVARDGGNVVTQGTVIFKDGVPIGIKT